MRTYKAKFQSETDWHVRASLVDLYHIIKRRKVIRWKVKDTAKYFGISPSHASEDLLIIRNIELVQHARSRNHALKLIRRFTK